MAGACVDKLPHSCGTRRGLQVFQKEDGTYDGYCFSCKTYVADPYADKPAGWKPDPIFKKSPEEIQAEMKAIGGFQVLDLPERRLKKSSLDYFGVKVGVKGEDGITPDITFFPYKVEGELTGYKAKTLAHKSFWGIGNTGDVDLFGWDKAIASGSKTLYITEGEFDAVALYQIIKDHNANTAYAANEPAVCSLPHGASGADRDLIRLYEKLYKTFKEVVLVFDMDQAGKAAVDAVVKRYPHFKVATLPEKDVNDCLMQGKSKAAFNAIVFNAALPKNTRLVYGSSLKDAARKQAEWGFSWPWKALTDETRGIRMGETYYFGAGVKMGKSEVVNAIAAHFITEHGWSVFMAKPEENNRKTYQMLVGKVAGKIFHDPTIPFDYEAFDKAEPLIGDKALMLNLYQHLDWDTLKGDIIAAVSAGAKAVIIDPITNLTNQVSSAEANEKLIAISSDLSALAMDLNIVVLIFCHLKAPENGPAHERGGKVLSHQFAGSRAMMRSCNYMIGLEGNKDPDLPLEERNMRTLVILEDREFGRTARIPLYWDHKTGVFQEIHYGN